MSEKTAAPETEQAEAQDTESLLFGSIPMDEEMTEEEEKALVSGEKSGTSRFARGCLEVGAVLLVLAAVFMVLETKAHLCFCYTWPPHVLSLSCIAGSMLSDDGAVCARTQYLRYDGNDSERVDGAAGACDDLSG